MVPAQIKHFQGIKLRNLIRDGAPDEIVAEIENLQRGALREVERNRLIEEVVSEVEMREVRKLADGIRNLTRKIGALEGYGRDIECRSGDAGNASPVAAVKRGGVGPGRESIVRVFNGGLE